MRDLELYVENRLIPLKTDGTFYKDQFKDYFWLYHYTHYALYVTEYSN